MYKILMKYISRPKMEWLLPEMLHQQTEILQLSCSYKCSSWADMQHIPSANPPKPTQLWLLTPNKVDYLSPVKQIFCICLFLALYSLSHKSFLLSALFGSSPKGDFPFHWSLLVPPELTSFIIFKVFWWQNCFVKVFVKHPKSPNPAAHPP